MFAQNADMLSRLRKSGVIPWHCRGLILSRALIRRSLGADSPKWEVCVRSNPPSDGLTGIAAVREMFREASRLVFSVHSGIEEVVLREASLQDAPVFGHRLCLLLLGNSALRITFKVFFNDATLAHIESIQRSVEGRSPVNAVDFMREFANQTCGSAKAFLSSANVCVAMSLPLATRGFDEIFTPANQNRNLLTDTWSLEFGSQEVVCSTMIDVLAWSEVEAVRWSPPRDDDAYPLEILS